MANRLYLDAANHAAVVGLVRQFGLRPVIDAVGAAALELSQAGETVKNEFGEAMDQGDIEIASRNLTEGDLY